MFDIFDDLIYIRFGEIPKDEKGVSVWDAIKFSDGYHLVAPLYANSCTYRDFTNSAFPDACCGCDKGTRIFVVTGNEIGKGADNEPLLKNIKIIEELPYDYFRMDIKEMTKEQEFRKQTEEAKFEAFSVMCKRVTKLEKENAILKKH